MRAVSRSLAVAALVAAACASDDKLSFSSLAGTWDATEFLYIDQADASNTYDLLAALGLALAIEVRANGTVIVLLDGSVSDSSVATLQGDVITLNAGGDDDWRVVLNGNTMTWTSLFPFVFDFGSDGTPEDVVMRVRWARR